MKEFSDLSRKVGRRFVMAGLAMGATAENVTLQRAREVVRSMRRPHKGVTFKMADEVVRKVALERRGRRVRRLMLRMRCERNSPTHEILHDNISSGKTLRDRLNVRRAAIMRDVALDITDRWNCRGSMAWKFATDVSEVSASVTKHKSWHQRGRYGSMRIYRVDVSLTVARDWFAMPAWLRCVDGLHTLAAERRPELEKQGSETVFEAAWVVYDATAVRVERGFILAHEIDGVRHTAHGISPRGCRASITRSRTDVGGGRLRRPIPEELGDIVVSVDDSLNAGNCSTGTYSWVNRFFPGRSSATIRELLAADPGNRKLERACIYALKRIRQVAAGV